MDENLKLKRYLILQSFAPLFLLILIKNFSINRIILIGKFIKSLLKTEFSVLFKLFNNKETLVVIVIIICIIWILFSIFAYWQFSNFQTSGFEEEDRMNIKGYTTDAGVGFFMTFVLPLVIDDIDKLNNFIVFFLMIFLIIILMWRTNLYYQNPVLTILGYTSFSFEMGKSDDKRFEGKECIGITKNKINGSGVIKYQRIADNVFVVYDKNGGDNNAKN